MRMTSCHWAIMATDTGGTDRVCSQLVKLPQLVISIASQYPTAIVAYTAAKDIPATLAKFAELGQPWLEPD